MYDIMENPNIFAFGASFDKVDVSEKFVDNNVVGIGWSEEDAPEFQYFVSSINVGDIVYIKARPIGGPIIVKAIGKVVNETVLKNIHIGGKHHISFGVQVEWLYTKMFKIPIPIEKNNVRMNAMYQEFHPDIRDIILSKL